MKLILSLALLVFASFVAPQLFTAHELRVAEINTRAFLCDGTNHELATGLQNVRIRKVYFWFGAYSQTYADIVLTLELVDAHGAYQSIAKMNWDRYAEPTSVAGETVWFDYTPDWVRVGADERLMLYAACSPLDDNAKTKWAHVIVLIYYFEE